jgi:hypothetical protein
MANLKYYAQKDALGFPIPGTMMATTGIVPEDSMEISIDTVLPIHPDGLKYIVRLNKKDEIIPNSLVIVLDLPKGNILDLTATRFDSLLTEDNFSLIAENEDLIIL